MLPHEPVTLSQMHVCFTSRLPVLQSVYALPAIAVSIICNKQESPANHMRSRHRLDVTLVGSLQGIFCSKASCPLLILLPDTVCMHDAGLWPYSFSSNALQAYNQSTTAFNKAMALH